jgi:hypothetical protein
MTAENVPIDRRVLPALIERRYRIPFLTQSHVHTHTVRKTEMRPVGALPLLLSLYVRPFFASALAFFAGNGLYGHHNPLFYLFPSYSAFNVFGHMLGGTLVSGKDVLLLSLYAADFVILMMLFALWRFRTKELV